LVKPTGDANSDYQELTLGWHMPIIGRLRQEELEFKASLELHSKTLSQPVILATQEAEIRRIAF
jgi:hypothetical protein